MPREKWTSLSPSFYNAPSLPIVNRWVWPLWRSKIVKTRHCWTLITCWTPQVVGLLCCGTLVMQLRCAMRFESHTPKSQEAGAVPTKGCSRDAPFIFFILMGPFARTLFFSNTSALTNSLLLRTNSTCKILEHLVWSNNSGFQFWGPLARTNFLSALCGLPKIASDKTFFASDAKALCLLSNYRKNDRNYPAKMLRCWPAMQNIGVYIV